jgi:hypothetical protein
MDSSAGKVITLVTIRPLLQEDAVLSVLCLLALMVLMNFLSEVSIMHSILEINVYEIVYYSIYISDLIILLL